MSDFVTKDSGQRQTFSTGMQRDSGQKDLRPDLVYGPMLVRWSELMGRGAGKYGERNWEKACTQEELDRFKASAFRHFVQWFYGMNPEEDHAAAVFFNVAGTEYVRERMKEGALKAPAEPEPLKVGDRVLIVGAERSNYAGRRGVITGDLDCDGDFVVSQIEGLHGDDSWSYFRPDELARA